MSVTEKLVNLIEEETPYTKADYEKAKDEYEVLKEGHTIALKTVKTALEKNMGTSYHSESPETDAVLAAIDGENNPLAEVNKTPGQVLLEAAQDVAVFEPKLKEAETHLNEVRIEYLPQEWESLTKNEPFFLGSDNDLLEYMRVSKLVDVNELGKGFARKQLALRTGTNQTEIWEIVAQHAQKRQERIKQLNGLIEAAEGPTKEGYKERLNGLQRQDEIKKEYMTAYTYLSEIDQQT
ncbi:MAG: hypothetical protein ACOZAO_01765 [Patescibacteria group bacterium]